MSKDVFPLEQSQAEKLAEIGTFLREAREDRLLTLEQVSSKTMIQPRILKAIESGKMQQLPEPVYIQGYIKRYAEALGLDGAAYASKFPLELDIRAIQPSWKDSPAAQLRPVHLYAVYVLLIIAAISGLSYLMSRSASWVASNSTTGRSPTAASTSASTSSSTSAASSPVPSPSASASASVTSEITPSPTATDKPVRVDITLTAQSWLRVEVDGKTDFQGILPEGTQRTWTASKELNVRVGNAGAVMLAYNNGEAVRLGEPGAVKEVTFSANQQSASLPNPIDSSIR